MFGIIDKNKKVITEKPISLKKEYNNIKGFHTLTLAELNKHGWYEAEIIEVEPKTNLHIVKYKTKFDKRKKKVIFTEVLVFKQNYRSILHSMLIDKKLNFTIQNEQFSILEDEIPLLLSGELGSYSIGNKKTDINTVCKEYKERYKILYTLYKELLNNPTNELLKKFLEV